MLVTSLPLLKSYHDLEYLDTAAATGSPDAPVALILHWGGASGRIGLPFARLLPGWRIVAPSLRGHGQNRFPTASVEVCAHDVLDLLRQLDLERIDRLYAYSLGAYVATRLFDNVEIGEAVLLAGGVVPFGVAWPTLFDEADPEQPETLVWLREQRASLELPGRGAADIQEEWEMVLIVLADILDLSQQRLTLRVSKEELRPALASIWCDDYFATPGRLPQRLLFWNGNDPVVCQPYIEQFMRHLCCREAILTSDPFDVRLSHVAQVIALLDGL
jgi:pimeloyl-ACP methyl ester carboxylesterase